MRIVLNQSPALFSMSQRAYARLVELGVPSKASPTQRTEQDEPVCVYDETLSGVVVSDNPDDAVTAPMGWVHTDFRYSCEDFIFGENRTHPLLVQVVQELGAAANADDARLHVFDIPDDVVYTIMRDPAGWEIAAWPD